MLKLLGSKGGGGGGRLSIEYVILELKRIHYTIAFL